jgi:hypothetical protein
MPMALEVSEAALFEGTTKICGIGKRGTSGFIREHDITVDIRDG